jgi:hypothetical protein
MPTYLNGPAWPMHWWVACVLLLWAGYLATVFGYLS